MVTFYHSYQNQNSLSSHDSLMIQGPSKRSSSDRVYPVSSVKECNRKGGKCKISRVLQSPVSNPQASPKVEVSDRLEQAQHLSIRGKVQNGNPRVRQGFSGPRGMGGVHRLVRRLPSHPHPPKLKYLRFCHRSQVFQFISFPFGLATAPQVFIMIVKEVKLMALTRGIRLHQYLDDWLIRAHSQKEAQMNTQTQSLGWIINQEKSELKPTQVFSFVGYEYHLDSALVKPTQERWFKRQDLILCLKTKHVLTARCLMSLIGLLASMEKMVPEGRLHMRPFQFYDSTQEIARNVTKTLTLMQQKGLISDKIFDHLNPVDCTEARFYMLPKIHKKGVPGGKPPY